MNLQELHVSEKDVSAVSLFKGELATATSIHLRKNGILKEHITKTSALLLCISGKVTYQDETDKQIVLERGDYTPIEPNVKHWLNAALDSQLVLLK
ncbi:hypothetical protein P872_12895 [Rhodonellum psychrophilum GCM71 = DSM 17998]|uniref:Uncharacterized protein n=2 Tax=Rhodonellum TaxID=336827 RepID=U5BRM4_9BACT|nr:MULTISPECIES: cupin domain-containing protein [Rhodonellum]ERM80538.1 hypothetical protein P872_12895 [Rhodonellum psychrophilum GCM71 = DSM 17998]SDZ31508.1 Cupin domain-containing protein [Rhodonellum ikkaensis]